jgi:hypothetical protein
VLAVLGVTRNLDGDDVLGDIVTPVGAEGGTEDPGAMMKAPRSLYSRQRGWHPHAQQAGLRSTKGEVSM